MSTSSRKEEVMAAGSDTQHYRRENVTIHWDRSYRVHHESASKALWKVVRNTRTYIAELGRSGAMKFGYEVPKKAISRGGCGVVQLSVQMYENELALLMRESRKDLAFSLTTRVYSPLLSAIEFTTVVTIAGTVGYNMYKYIMSEGIWRRLMHTSSDGIVGMLIRKLPQVVKPEAIGLEIVYSPYNSGYTIYKNFSSPAVEYLAGSISGAIAGLIYYWTRTWKCYDVIFTCDALAWELMNKHPNLGRTQLTTDGISSHPIVTTLVQDVNSKLPIGDSVIKVRYNAVLRFLVAMFCDGRIECMSERASLEVADAPIPGVDLEDAVNVKTELNNLQNGEREVVNVRLNTAPLKNLRKTVTMTRRSDDELVCEKERGIKRMLAYEDYVPEQAGGVLIGPQLSDVSESLSQSPENEKASTSRHLSYLVSTVDGKQLPLDEDGSVYVSPEANKRLDAAADLIGDQMAEQIAKDQEHMFDFSDPNGYYPVKWGASAWEKVKEWVAAQGEYIPPRLAGFIKQYELALPLNKLPRMVVSQGLEATAMSSEFWAVIENLMKKSYPHLVTKGKTEEEVAAQIADMCRRSKALKRVLFSIDMKSMDASWTVEDRKRVVGIARKILSKVEERLETDLKKFGDPILSGKAGEKIRVNLHYIRLAMEKCDAILFSGERMTSTGNRLLMLILVAAEFMRVYPDEGEHLVKEMLYYPDAAKKMAKDNRDPSRMNEQMIDFQHYTYEEGWITRENAEGRKCKFPKEARDVFFDENGVRPDQNCNGGDGDDDLLSLRADMYESEEQMIRAWEEYGKLIEVCSAWGETDNAEVLSKYIITTGIYPYKKTWCIPKVQRNFGRLLMAKFHIASGLFKSNGVYGYKLTQNNWIEIATQMWNRSFALKHTLILRQLCAGMFKMCVRNIGDAWMDKGSIYDDDGHRMGKIDGDVKLSEMYEQLMHNVHCIDEGHRWGAANALLRAMRFKTFGKMSCAKVKELQAAILDADECWKEIELSEEMCHNPWLFVDSYPVHPEIAEELGYTAALVNRMKAVNGSQLDCSCTEPDAAENNTYLVKGQSESPEMSRPCGAGSARDAGADGRKIAVFVMVGEEDAKYADVSERKVLVGEENISSKRKGYVSLPGGKVDDCDYQEAKEKGLPFWICTAIRELREETGYHVQAGSLTLVSMFDFCGGLNYVVYTTKENLSEARFTSGKHEQLLDLKWRTPAEIFDHWHSKKISENVWRIIDLKKSERELRGVYKPFNELTQYKIVSNSGLVLFLHHTGTACTSKHNFAIRKFPLEVYDLTKKTSPSGSEVRPQSGRAGRSHHHPRVGEEGAIAPAQQIISPLPQGHTNDVGSMRHGRGTGGNGKPPESRYGMASGPAMKGSTAQNTDQALADDVGALPTEREPEFATPVNPPLEHIENQSLRAVVKSDPGLPVAGLSNTDGVGEVDARGLGLAVQLPRPRPPLIKTAEAVHNHRRPVDSVRGEIGDRKATKGSGKVGPAAQQKRAGKPTSGKSPIPDASSQPVSSRGSRNIEEGRPDSESGQRIWKPKTPSGA